MTEIHNSLSGAERSVGDSDSIDLNNRAACLINPVSGIANDFLNHFNEILLLVENLPLLLPEMIDELLQWAPTTYIEYFKRSKLPGSAGALARYSDLPSEARHHFDEHVDRLNDMATAIVAKIWMHRKSDGSIPPDEVSEYCELASAEFGAELDRLATFVKCGYAACCIDPCSIENAHLSF